MKTLYIKVMYVMGKGKPLSLLWVWVQLNSLYSYSSSRKAALFLAIRLCRNQPRRGSCCLWSVNALWVLVVCGSHVHLVTRLQGWLKWKPIVHKIAHYTYFHMINPLKPELNPICYLLALLGVHHFLHVSRIRVKSLTFRLLMSYIYGAPILDVSRSHTTTQHSR